MRIEQRKCEKKRGFTLVELCVTLGILTFLLLIGVPGLRDFIIAHRLSLATDRLVSTLRYARAEAVTRGVSVTVCRRAEPGHQECDTERGHQAWQHGWLVKPHHSEDVLRQTSAADLPPTVNVIANLGINTQITYNSMGNSTVAGHVALHGEHHVRLVCISRARIRVAKGASC